MGDLLEFSLHSRFSIELFCAYAVLNTTNEARAGEHLAVRLEQIAQFFRRRARQR